MTDVYVNDEGLIVDQFDQYVTDQDGMPLTESEYDTLVARADEAFVDAIRPAYHRLLTTLGREPTDAELTKLLEDAEATGNPNIDENYERVTKRSLSANLGDDDVRLRVFAEYADEADADGDESAEDAEAGD
jgi:hypothetical protein